jgi:hypothetical protein
MLERQATQIPNDIVVRLLRIYPGRTGNIYMPGIYKPGELPKSAYNSYYVTPLDPKDLVKVDLPQAMDEGEIHNGSFKVEELLKREEVKGLTESISINQQTKGHDKHIKAKLIKTVQAPPLKINHATKEDLTGLNGVGNSTASKILQLREHAPFINYDDLNKRVSLALGKDWTAFDISFE